MYSLEESAQFTALIVVAGLILLFIIREFYVSKMLNKCRSIIQNELVDSLRKGLSLELEQALTKAFENSMETFVNESFKKFRSSAGGKASGKGNKDSGGGGGGGLGDIIQMGMKLVPEVLKMLGGKKDKK